MVFENLIIGNYVDVILPGIVKGEYFFEWCFKNSCNSERKLQGRRVLAIFDGYNGLPRYTNLVSQLLLCHFVGMKPELSDIVCNRTFIHNQNPLR